MNKILFAILTLLSAGLSAQVQIGAEGNLEPVGAFAAMKNAAIQGGYHVANDTSDLADYLKLNSVVLQLSDKTAYYFQAGEWVKIPVGAGASSTNPYFVDDDTTTVFRHYDNFDPFVIEWFTTGIGHDTTLIIGRDQIKIMKPLVGDYAPSLQSVTDKGNSTSKELIIQGVRFAADMNTSINIGDVNTGKNSNANRVISIGAGSGQNNTGYGSNFIGYYAGSSNSGGSGNFWGHFSGELNSGTYVNAFGDYTAKNNTGSHVNAMGLNSGRDNDGSSVTFSGQYAGYNNSGDYVVFIGDRVGMNNDKDSVIALGRYQTNPSPSQWYSQSVSFNGQYPNGKKTFNLPAGYQIFIGGVNKSAQWDAGGGSYDDSEVRDSIRLAFTEIDAIGGGAADGVATAGAFDLANSEIDVTVASPGTSFSIDVSGMLNYTNLTNTPTIPTLISELTNDSGFLTSEVDAVFVASDAYGITATDISNWNAAFAHISDTENPHSVTATQVGAYTEGEVDALLGTKADQSNTYTKAEVTAITDSLEAEINRLKFNRVEITTSKTLTAGDVYTRQYKTAPGPATLTIPFDFVDMEIGDQIIIQPISGHIIVASASGVFLNGVDNTSLMNSPPYAARVLEKIGANDYVLYVNSFNWVFLLVFFFGYTRKSLIE